MSICNCVGPLGACPCMKKSDFLIKAYAESGFRLRQEIKTLRENIYERDEIDERYRKNMTLEIEKQKEANNKLQNAYNVVCDRIDGKNMLIHELQKQIESYEQMIEELKKEIRES